MHRFGLVVVVVSEAVGEAGAVSDVNRAHIYIAGHPRSSLTIHSFIHLNPPCQSKRPSPHAA